jgi:hypothetical protein
MEVSVNETIKMRVMADGVYVFDNCIKVAPASSTLGTVFARMPDVMRIALTNREGVTLAYERVEDE